MKVFCFCLCRYHYFLSSVLYHIHESLFSSSPPLLHLNWFCYSGLFAYGAWLSVESRGNHALQTLQYLIQFPMLSLLLFLFWFFGFFFKIIIGIEIEWWPPSQWSRLRSFACFCQSRGMIYLLLIFFCDLYSLLSYFNWIYVFKFSSISSAVWWAEIL